MSNVTRKLILVNSLSNGGAERVAVNIANYISNEGGEVIIATLDNKTDNEYKLNSNVNVIYLPRFILFDFLFKVLYLIYLVNKYNVRFVQSHMYRANYINVFSRLLYPRYFSQVVNHSDPYRYYDKGLLGRVSLFLIKFLYPKSDSIVSITQIMKERLSYICGSKYSHKFLVIHNPSDIDSIIKHSSMPVSIKLPDEYFVAMGRLIKLKDFNLLLESVSILNYNLVIIGDGEEILNLKSKASELNILNKVHFLGHLSNPFPILSNSIALISASKTEGLPNSIIESFACGIPVIHSDCFTGPRDIMSPKSDPNIVLTHDDIEITPFGILFPVGSLNGLVSSLKYIMDNKEYYTSTKFECRARAYDFSLNNNVNKYFDLIGF